MQHANRDDLALAGVFERREADWRQGAVVNQVLVDRYAPSADLDAKRNLYPPPKRLRGWDELPTQGHYLGAHKLWSHEIDFWGGDLASTASRLPHVQSLGAGRLLPPGYTSGRGAGRPSPYRSASRTSALASSRRNRPSSMRYSPRFCSCRSVRLV